jgi:AraC family transcriptional regulator, regulatory protein of adaptative response / methylated-DNA-[protein]-cysteine methyltransferase
MLLMAYNVQMNQYQSIEKVIHYMVENSKKALSVNDIAQHVGISTSHLQKLFVNWCGVSPIQFQRFLKVEYAKGLLLEKNSMLATSNKSGLSSSGRLHDLFVDIEAMTPGEYKNAGQNLTINYFTHDSKFGNYLIASTTKGICNILFLDTPDQALSELQARWPHATLIQSQSPNHTPIIQFFTHQNPTTKIKLHLHGTNYQLKVWQALLSIPEGKIQTYGDIAKFIGDTTGIASRAAGTAIGANPIGYLIPCHRVLKSTGAISGYRWGVVRKQAILGWEANQIINN